MLEHVHDEDGGEKTETVGHKPRVEVRPLVVLQTGKKHRHNIHETM